MFFSILILIIILFLCVLMVFFNVRESFSEKKPPKILIMVISQNGKHKRWNYEKENWLKKFKPKDSISLELIECDNMVNENFIHSYHCIESYKPGIFQKTILTMQSNIDKYDYFVRTNLSTFVIQDRLKSYLTHLNQSNVYDGVYCSKNANWIAGWGVVLDKNTCNMLIQDGIKEENFNKRVSDDVLIGKILKSHNVQCNTKHRAHLGYAWKYNKTIKENIESIQQKPNVMFIRLTQRGLDKDMIKKEKYTNALNALYEVFG